MPDWSLHGWDEPPEYAEMRQYFGLIVEPIIEVVRQCDDNHHAAFAAKYLLDKVVWGVTTCVDKHKLNLRYLSEGARNVFVELDAPVRATAGRRRELLKSLRHEHVVPRRVVIARLMQGDSAVLSEAIACVVTVDEHARLGDGDGWQRYWDADIRVWDRAVGDWLESTPVASRFATADEQLNEETHAAEESNKARSTAMPRLTSAGRSPVVEADILAALTAVGLQPNKDSVGFRGADGSVAGRYIWWPKTKRGVVRTLHLGRYRADTPLTRPIDNGNVRFEVHFVGAPRDAAIASLHEAIRLLVQRQ